MKPRMNRRRDEEGMRRTVLPVGRQCDAYEMQLTPAGLAGLAELPVDHGALPATSETLVRDLLAAVPGDQATLIRNFFSTPRTPARVLDFGTEWSNQTWNTLQALKVAADSGGWAVVELTSKYNEMMERWNKRHPAKEAFRSHLRSLLPPTAPVDEATQLEAMRQAASYAGMTAEMAKFGAQVHGQIKAIERENSLLGNDTLAKRLAISSEAINKTINTAAGFTLRAVPWWVWVGGAVFFLGPIILPALLGRSIARAA